MEELAKLISGSGVTSHASIRKARKVIEAGFRRPGPAKVLSLNKLRLIILNTHAHCRKEGLTNQYLESNVGEAIAKALYAAQTGETE